MKSLLASIVASLLVILAVIAAGEHHGISVTVYKAFISTYWLTLPIVLVGIFVDLFGDKK